MEIIVFNVSSNSPCSNSNYRISTKKIWFKRIKTKFKTGKQKRKKKKKNEKKKKKKLTGRPNWPTAAQPARPVRSISPVYISSQTTYLHEKHYLQLRIDPRFRLLDPYSKIYLSHRSMPPYTALINADLRFPLRNLEIPSARILFRSFDHLNFVFCLRPLNESCRSRRDLSIPTNLSFYHPPQRDKLRSQVFWSDGVIPRLIRARCSKSKFLWWVFRSDHSLQLFFLEFFNLTDGFVSRRQIYFEGNRSLNLISDRRGLNTEVVPLIKIFNSSDFQLDPFIEQGDFRVARFRSYKV